MKSPLLTIIFLLTVVTAFSQNRISGKVTLGSSVAVNSTVSLLKSADSSLVKLALTNNEGAFEFLNIANGIYLVKAGHTNTTTVMSQIFELSENNNDIKLPALNLQPTAKELSGVTVTSRKPFLERKPDKTVMNVEASITAAGSNALEMLQKAPGVVVDNNDKISLQGKDGVVVMIDDKPTYMSNNDLINYLKNLPASALETIEIMTNPSSKYDASGNAGILNIKTKKTRIKGFNGSVSTSFGHGKYPVTNNSLNLNFRRNKVNLFGNFSQSYRKGYNNLFLDREFYNDTKVPYAFFSQGNYRKDEGAGVNGKLGLDYYITPKTTIGFVARGNRFHYSQNSTNDSKIMDAKRQLDSIVSTKSETDMWFNNYSFNANIRHKLDSTGKEISFDADYLVYPNEQNQDITNSTFGTGNDMLRSYNLIGKLPSDIAIYSFKTDYTQTVFKNGKLETGLKYSKVNTENLAGYFLRKGSTLNPDYTRSNNFNYNEEIAAAYLSLNKQINKLGVQTGLRLENTTYHGRSYGNPTQADSSFKKSYLSFFPTIYLTYKLSEKNLLDANLGRRINRPDYQSLNPFMMYLDPYTLSSGNPYLLPSYSYVAELGYTYNNWLNIKANYSHDKNLISSMFEQRGLISIQKEGNFGFRKTAGLTASGQIPVKKWWSLVAYAMVNRHHYNGFLNNQDVHIRITNSILNLQNMFTFKNDWAAEVSGFYGTGFNEGQLIIDDLANLSAGVSKKVLKKKGTLKLNVSDILYTQGNVSGYGDLQTAYAWFNQKRDSRRATISFTYNFGKPFQSTGSRRSGGAGEEQGRVKSGGGGGK